MQQFRTRPDQVGKPVTEVSKAGGEAWHSLTQEEKDVSRPLPSLSLPAINTVIQRYKHYEHKPTEPTTA